MLLPSNTSSFMISLPSNQSIVLLYHFSHGNLSVIITSIQFLRDCAQSCGRIYSAESLSKRKANNPAADLPTGNVFGMHAAGRNTL